MMNLNIQLQAVENEHESFIQALELIVEDIKGGYEKNHVRTKLVEGKWSIDPV